MVKRVWLGGIFITGLYFCSYQGFEGLKFLEGLGPVMHRAVNVTLLILVAAAGYFGLSYQKQKWIHLLWLALYCCVLFSLGILGVIHLLTTITNESVREFAGYLLLFFISPVPYGILIFLIKIEDKLKASVQNDKAK
jgi:hypothetical protein